jgi:predicted ATPase/DNA-binding SARP family transcriptional activator
MTSSTTPEVVPAEGDVATSAPGLPTPLTRFVGRQRELGDISRLLRGSRLLTLTGAGGSGKTRLAREGAAHLSPALGSILWVDLAALSDPALVATQLAAVMGVHERNASMLEGVILALQGGTHLVVLDNCEHLVEACAELAEALLRSCPGVRVLATSREALGVPGETAWLVPPLAEAEAVQLFVERAQAALPSFSLSAASAPHVAEICRRLDGIPLALELAAARVRVLAPEQILERLNDAFRLLTVGNRTALPRHRTLRGTMDWSFALLGSREQVLLRRLAVFAGSFSLDAVEAVCVGAPLEEGDILDGVAALVDKSLVEFEAGEGDARYRLLETVRQYGVERLRESDELTGLRERHAAYFVALAELAEPHLFAGAANPVWMTRVAKEIGNLRAAFDWGVEEAGRADVALRLGAALHWYWFARARFREGRQRMRTAIALTSDRCPPRSRARALIALGHIALWQGDVPAIRPPIEEGLGLLRTLDDPTSLAYALNGVGAGHFMEGDPVQAGAHFEEALAVCRTLPPTALLSLILYWRGQAALQRGEVELARASYEEAARHGRLVDHRPAMAHPLTMLGRLAVSGGALREAFEYFVESLGMHQETDDGYGISQCLEGLAAVAILVGRFERGVLLAGAVDAFRELLAMPLSPLEKLEQDRVVERARAAIGAGLDDAWARGRALGKDEAVQLALAEVPPRTSEFRVPAGAAPRPAAAPTPLSAVALEVHALGPLRVVRDGEGVDPSAWGSARARELLVLLMAHPEGRTKEQIGAAFWPEASATQVRNSFHVTLHRLRKALRHPEWVILAGDRYRVDPAVPATFDARRFEDDVTGALRAARRTEPGAPAALEEGLSRYEGDFLDGEPAGDWHLELRDRLQRLYVDGLMMLGGVLLAEDRLPRAAETYRRALARDSLHEEAWRQLMICHARQGERAQAMRLFQRLSELLQRELEADPDPASAALHERLQRGEPI